MNAPLKEGRSEGSIADANKLPTHNAHCDATHAPPDPTNRRQPVSGKTRDLSGVRLDHLFLDGSHFKMHPGAPAEPVLAAWGIDTDGKPIFGPGSGCVGVDRRVGRLPFLVARGLGAPLLGIRCGHGG